MVEQSSPESKHDSATHLSDKQGISSTVAADCTTDTVPEVAEDSNDVPSAISTNGITSSTESPTRLSPESAKRALSEHCPEEEPKSKRLKASSLAHLTRNGSSSEPYSSSVPECSAMKPNKETWQGFCDIESDPAYFSVILREMGVQSVTVREVFAMDPAILEMLPQPIYGLILLFNYREFGNSDQPTECPAHVWFANQLPAQNSCATLAMINILMNSNDVGIGEHLNHFKDFTREFTSFQRGEALASFDFVKKIHNSFAKQMDILESDKFLSHKVKRAQRMKNEKKEKQEKISKKGTKSRRRSADSAETNDSAEGHEEHAHHFIAFVPVDNEVWKLDGMDSQPTSMGTFDAANGETWLSAVSDTIAALMAAGDDEYGVIALAQSPLHSLRKQACLAINTMKYIESRLDTLDKGWRSFIIVDQEPPSPKILGVEEHLSDYPVPNAIAANISSEQMSDLLDRRSRLVGELSKTAASIIAEIQSEAEEDQKATQRRYDCGPVIKKWLEMLAANGHLAENLDRFMPAGKKGVK
ncbi:Nn.00g052670.m01.CDS01 [Neocucurbitaria sp. VM-36]